MNKHPLFAQFSQGINWNAASYIAYKLLFTLLSFVLYRHLTTYDFSVWSTINSVVFLALLWLDFGLRKSIPRFCLVFCTTRQSHRSFIRAIILFQLVVLGVSVLLAFGLSHLLNHKLFGIDAYLVHLACCMLFTEGLVAVCRLLFHAHFKQKQFNIVASTLQLLETFANMLCIAFIPYESLLYGIFITKIATAVLIILSSFYQMNTLYSNTVYPATVTPPINDEAKRRAFIKHSGIMWLSTSLKSLTERNVMVPFLTYSLGASAANLFKITNDVALFFYRSIVRTIGTTDTSLLAHANHSSDRQQLVPEAFNKLISTILILSLPVCAIVASSILFKQVLPLDPLALQLFCVITISYLVETILSPYERILEVKENYTTLFLSYIPYIVGIIALAVHYHAFQTLALLHGIILIQAIRISGSCVMAYAAHKRYHLPLPLGQIKKFLVIGAPLYALISFALNYLPAGAAVTEALRNFVLFS